MDEEERKVTFKIPKINAWMIATLVLAILCLILVTGWPVNLTGRVVETGGSVETTALTKEQAAQMTIDYINNNLVQTGYVSLVSVEEFNDLYEVLTSYQGQEIPVYVTKDGNFLFSFIADTSQEIPQQQEGQEFDAPDKEIPEADLFVMSFCPYGVQAGNLMKSVVDLLGDKTDIKVRFIASVQGDTVDSVQSLHGINEAKEDLRQICVMKHYDQETFWNYLMDVNENCYPVYSDAEELDACWKDAAQKFGIDVNKIETCAYGSEGLNLLKEDEQLADQYGVSGSPTLIINGARYSGSRSSEAFKQAICSGFTTQPSECGQTLSGESSSAQGAC